MFVTSYIDCVVSLPGNIYAAHKLEMEKRVLDILPSAVMLRAEWMYDYYEKRSNYLMMILNAIHTQDSVSFSSKQFRGITYLKEVAENMDKVISKTPTADFFVSFS